MKKLIMCKGLPASGKSTWANDQILAHNDWPKQPYTVVNKDLIRLHLGKPWSHQVEKEVIQTRDRRIIDLFTKSGVEVVISDDTNLSPKHERRLRQLAKEAGAEFEINSTFLQVPLDECLRRNALREPPARVDGRVILDMHAQYLAPKTPPQEVVIEPYTPDLGRPPAIICDLDGTLALHNGRGPFDFPKCDTDKVNKPILGLLWAMHKSGYTVIYLSGRDDSCQEKTQQWLKVNFCPNGHYLYMRQTGDKRKDSIVKLELFNTHIRRNFNVLFTLDDRDQVVKLWRDLGLTCLQVAYGNF